MSKTIVPSDNTPHTTHPPSHTYSPLPFHTRRRSDRIDPLVFVGRSWSVVDIVDIGEGWEVIPSYKRRVLEE